MDDFNLAEADIVPVLEGLEKMNAIFGGHKTIINALKKLNVQNGWHISDWGCGGGGTLRAIATWATYNRLKINLTGADAAHSAIRFARNRAGPFLNIEFIETDVIADKLTEKQFDVVYSSLFTHHFTDEEWIVLVKKMLLCSRKAVIITDLHRHWLLYHTVILITRVFTTNKMVRFDGPLSVKRAFKKAELIGLLSKCGIVNYKIAWRWAFRWEVIINKG